ncbi:MAG TPA: hypothetical protein VND95_10070 [Stellaceae bacterium]|nr:hypothetical protein [Stellaceae bacterium]
MTTRQAGGIALVLLVLSTFLSVVLRGVELVEERHSLAELRDLQDKPLRETANVRRQFGALAAGVVSLAAAGDGDAKAIVEEMRGHGVTLSAAKPAASQ